MAELIIVAHPESGKLFTATEKNADWSKCQVRQKGTKVTNGVISNASRSAFPLIQTSVAEDLLKQGLKSGDKFPIEGQIVRRMSKVPFYEGQLPVSNPTTGEVMKKDGEPYYMQDTFTSDIAEPSEAWVVAELKVNA